MIELTAGDFGEKIYFEIYDKDDNPVDLTGAEITFFWRKITATTWNKGDGAIESALEGLCSYTTEADDFDEAGQFIGAIRTEWTGIKRKTYSNRKITVSEEPIETPN